MKRTLLIIFTLCLTLTGIRAQEHKRLTNLPHVYINTFTGQDVWKAIEGHVLDKAAITGVYSLNPDVAAKL